MSPAGLTPAPAHLACHSVSVTNDNESGRAGGRLESGFFLMESARVLVLRRFGQSRHGQWTVDTRHGGRMLACCRWCKARQARYISTSLIRPVILCIGAIGTSHYRRDVRRHSRVTTDLDCRYPRRTCTGPYIISSSVAPAVSPEVRLLFGKFRAASTNSMVSVHPGNLMSRNGT